MTLTEENIRYPAYLSAGKIHYVSKVDGKSHEIGLLPWLFFIIVVFGSSLRNIFIGEFFGKTRLTGVFLTLPALYILLKISFTFINPNNSSDNELNSLVYTKFLTVTAHFARGPEVTYSFTSLVLGGVALLIILSMPSLIKEADKS
jgi:hypothetical protein